MGPYAEIPSRRKVTIVALLASLCPVGLVFLAVVSYRALQSEQNAIKAANTDAETIVAKVALSLVSNDVAVAQSELSALNQSPVLAACIYTRDGKVFAKYSRDGSGDFEFPLPELDSTQFQNGALDMFRGIEKDSEVVGTLYLRSEPASSLAGLPHRNAIICTLASVLLVLTIALAVWLRRLLKLHAEDTTGVIPLVPPGAKMIAPPSDVSRDELRLLNKKVDTIASKVEKIEKRLKQPTKTKASITPEQQPKKSVAHQAATFSPLDLNAATNRVLEQMRSKIMACNAEVVVQTNLPVVLAENAVVEQVLRSLIENALKFCPEGVRPRIRVGGCVNGDAVRLWVHDNGVGIAPEKQKLVFSASDREENSALALVKQRVENMRGQVGFDSAAGQGSTFWIELPKSQAATFN